MFVFSKPLAAFLCASTGGYRAGYCTVDSARQAWANGLSAQGYAVAQGSAWKIDTAGCAQITAVFGNCFGNNAAAPYIVPQPPVGVGYPVDPTYGSPFLTGQPPRFDHAARLSQARPKHQRQPGCHG
jgi:hypothetical protein